MRYEHLVWDIELKYFGVKLETRIKNSKLLAKNFLNLSTSLPWPNTCIPKTFALFGQVSLVEYFCTQGLLTLVAGESHAQAYFGPYCMSVFEVNDDDEE